MGKSDPIIFNSYLSILNQQSVYRDVGFFGFVKHNTFTSFIECEKAHFYDLELENWNINNFPYNVDKKFDLIVCTRVAYFCRDTEKMIHEFIKLLKPGGKILIDWGLGDHWRFDDYKIGWVKSNEHEWCYEEDNYLHSTIWDDSFLQHPEFISFVKNTEKFGYNLSSVKDSIYKEVPDVYEFLKDEKMIQSTKSIDMSILSLWEDKPQLYVIMLLERK